MSDDDSSPTKMVLTIVAVIGIALAGFFIYRSSRSVPQVQIDTAAIGVAKKSMEEHRSLPAQNQAQDPLTLAPSQETGLEAIGRGPKGQPPGGQAPNQNP